MGSFRHIVFVVDSVDINILVNVYSHFYRLYDVGYCELCERQLRLTINITIRISHGNWFTTINAVYSIWVLFNTEIKT